MREEILGHQGGKLEKLTLCSEVDVRGGRVGRGFVNMTEMAKDRKLVDDLLPCLQELAPICEGLEDKISVAYTDIYTGDLAFHANVKQAAKRGVPGTDTIYADLKERFPGRPSSNGNGGNGGGGGQPTP